MKTLREILNETKFDWKTGMISILDPDHEVYSDIFIYILKDDPRLDGLYHYFAHDEIYAYVSCYFSFYNKRGLFPAKFRKDTISTVEINLELYYENDPLKNQMIKALQDVDIVLTWDVQGDLDNTLSIVGSKQLPLFVVGSDDREAIYDFLLMVHSAIKQSQLTMGDQN